MNVFWEIRHTITELNGLVDTAVACLEPVEANFAREGRYSSLSGETNKLSFNRKWQELVAETETTFVRMIENRTQAALIKADPDNNTLSKADRKRFTTIVTEYSEICIEIVREAAKHALIETPGDSPAEN